MLHFTLTIVWINIWCLMVWCIMMVLFTFPLSQHYPLFNFVSYIISFSAFCDCQKSSARGWPSLCEVFITFFSDLLSYFVSCIVKLWSWVTSVGQHNCASWQLFNISDPTRSVEPKLISAGFKKKMKSLKYNLKCSKPLISFINA